MKECAERSAIFQPVPTPALLHLPTAYRPLEISVEPGNMECMKQMSTYRHLSLLYPVQGKYIS